jgi:hypothetical protein
MSATARDEPVTKAPQSDTTPTVGSDRPDAPEDATMDALTTTIPATLARMALVRRETLAVNGAYHAPTQDA